MCADADVRMGEGVQPSADKSGQGEGGVKNHQIFADILYGQPQSASNPRFHLMSTCHYHNIKFHKNVQRKYLQQTATVLFISRTYV